MSMIGTGTTREPVPFTSTRDEAREGSMAMNRFTEYLVAARVRHGERFDPCGLAEQFRPHYHSGKRIKVQFTSGEVMTGTVGASTGWQPVFLLMRRSNARGSSVILSAKDQIIGVQHNGRDYR